MMLVTSLRDGRASLDGMIYKACAFGIGLPRASLRRRRKEEPR